MRISDWSSDVCSSDLSSPPQEFAERSIGLRLARRVEEADSIEMIRDRAFIIGIAHRYGLAPVVMELVRLDMVGGSLATRDGLAEGGGLQDRGESAPAADTLAQIWRCWRRSEEHTSELQSLMRISYDVFSLKKKNENK